MCVVNVARLYSISTYLFLKKEQKKKQKKKQKRRGEEERVRMSQRRGYLPWI